MWTAPDPVVSGPAGSETGGRARKRRLAGMDKRGCPYAGGAARCLAGRPVVHPVAFIKRLPVGDRPVAVLLQSSFPVRARPCGVAMVATRGRDYDSTRPRTRLQGGAAGAARRLVPPVPSPQRLRRTRRKSTHPDVDHYNQEGASGVEEGDTLAPVADDGNSGSDGTAEVAAGTAPRRTRKNPHPRYIPPGSRAAVPSGSEAGHPSPGGDSDGKAVCCWGGYGPSASESASSSATSGGDVHPPFEDTSSAVDDVEPVAPPPEAILPPAIAPVEENHDRRSSLKRRVDEQHGAAGPAASPLVPASKAVPAPEFPAGIFADIKPKPVLHAAGVSTEVIPSNEVVAKREAFWAAAAAAAASGPGPRAQATTGQGARAGAGGARPRFAASQRPLMAMARAASQNGPAHGDSNSGSARETPGQDDGGARGGGGAAAGGGAGGDVGDGLGVGDSAVGDAQLRGGSSRRSGGGDSRGDGEDGTGPPTK